MSEDIANQPNGFPKKKLVKVKRLKPKGQGVPTPAAPTEQPQSPRPENHNLPDMVRNQNFTEDAFEPIPEDMEPEYENHGGGFAAVVAQQSIKFIALAAVLSFIVGFGIAKLITPTSTTVREGLQGVVINPEVPKGRARCGLVDKTQGCVLYIMNPQRQDLNAREFYDLAAQLTGRQRFVIDTGNMRYSNVKIRPGAIAQLNIPPLQ